MQKNCNCESLIPNCCHGGSKVIMVGSRFTTTSESNYAHKEGECLAVVDSLHRTRYYTLGCENLVICTDYKPLLGILKKKRFEQIDNPRIARLKHRKLSWKFKLVQIPGRLHGAPDSLSRYGTDDLKENATLGNTVACLSINDNYGTQHESLCEIDYIISSIDDSEGPLDAAKIKDASAKYSIISTVIHHIAAGTVPLD